MSHTKSKIYCIMTHSGHNNNPTEAAFSSKHQPIVSYKDIRA